MRWEPATKHHIIRPSDKQAPLYPLFGAREASMLAREQACWIPQEISGAEPLSTYINSILTHRYTHDHHLTPPNQNSRCYFFRLHGPSPTRSGRLCCPARSEPHSPWYHLPPNSLDLKD